MSVSNFIKHLVCTQTLLLRRTTTSSLNPHPFFSSHFRKLHVIPRRPALLLNNSAFSSSASHTPSAADCHFASPYLSARIQCPRNILDEFCESLLCFGAQSTSVDEEVDDHEADIKNEVCVTCTFSEKEDVHACISLAAGSIGLTTLPSYLVENGDQYEWINKTQESFQPLQIDKDTWIVPQWKIPPVNHALNIILNPGLAFGTGEHPTTKLCLLQLRKVINAGDCVLDFGTGSGVLAIAALKFGAASCLGVDIDPLAIASSCRNAALNHIQPEELQLLLMPSNEYLTNALSGNEAFEQNSYCKDAVLEINKYNVVIANILLNPLLELAESIVSYAKPGATIILSGVLTEQIPQIMECYSSYVEDLIITKIDDYACITGTKRKGQQQQP